MCPALAGGISTSEPPDKPLHLNCVNLCAYRCTLPAGQEGLPLPFLRSFYSSSSSTLPSRSLSGREGTVMTPKLHSLWLMCLGGSLWTRRIEWPNRRGQDLGWTSRARSSSSPVHSGEFTGSTRLLIQHLSRASCCCRRWQGWLEPLVGSWLQCLALNQCI